MSWRSSRGPEYRSRNDEGSALGGGSAGGPPLTTLIGACVLLGVVVLGLAIAGVRIGGPAPAPVAAQATAAPAAPAASQATAAPAAPAAAADIPTEAVGPAVATGDGEPLEIGSDGDLLLFDAATLTAPADTLVALTFNNNATAVQHNWVLVEGGADVAEAVNTIAGQQAGQARNVAAAVPPADAPGLLVASPIVNAGDNYTVTFQTPDAGSYIYLCTFPGHYQAGMVGELTVN